MTSAAVAAELDQAQHCDHKILQQNVEMLKVQAEHAGNAFSDVKLAAHVHNSCDTVLQVWSVIGECCEWAVHTWAEYGRLVT